MARLILKAPKGIPKAGLLAEYRFNEGSGQVLTDYSGNARHGQLGSAAGADAADPTWSTEGLVFSGAQYVILPDAADGSGVSTTGLSVFVVVYTAATAANTRILSSYIAAAGARSWSIHYALGNKFQTFLSTDGNTNQKQYEVAGILNLSKYSLIGFTFNAGTLNMYSNGGLLSPTKVSDLACPTVILPAQSPYVGATSDGSFPLTGTVCYALIYNRALSPAEIAQMYNYLKSYLKSKRGITLS